MFYIFDRACFVPPPLTYSFSPRASSTSIQTFRYVSIPSNSEKNEFRKGIPVGLNWWGNRSCLTARQITHAIYYAQAQHERLKNLYEYNPIWISKSGVVGRGERTLTSSWGI